MHDDTKKQLRAPLLRRRGVGVCRVGEEEREETRFFVLRSVGCHNTEVPYRAWPLGRMLAYLVYMCYF